VALWDEVDEPVLRWVRGLPPVFEQNRTYEMATRDPVPCEHIAGLRSDEAHDGLRRLADAGLIDADCTEYVSGAKWYGLRVTAGGLMVVDEWPDLDRVASVTGLQLLLQQFAESAEPEDKPVLRRAIGAVGRLGDELVKGTLKSVAGSAGGALPAPGARSGPAKGAES
jgi:hypothetical protein